MAKKGGKKQVSKREPSPRAVQREWIQEMREEIGYLNDMSVMAMADQGILPPFYGGEYLEEDVETIVLWGEMDNGQHEIGLLMLRVMDGVEPNRELRMARKEIEMTNDWSVADFFKQLKSMSESPAIELEKEFSTLMVSMILPGMQVQPVPGGDRQKMLDHIYEDLPYAIFLHIPLMPSEIPEEADYDWGSLDKYRAVAVCAETPQELEAAVWKYRLELALSIEIEDVKAEELDPEEVMLAPTVGELTAVFDIMVMNAVRYYGTTSPIKLRQQTLDIMRGEEGDLIVPAPLKVDIEPVPLLADARKDLNETAKDNILLHIKAESDVMRQMWPQVRPHSYYSLRLRHAMFRLGKSGQPRVDGFSPSPVVEWIIADSLPELYEKTLLHALRQMLISTGYIRTFVAPPELTDGLDADEDEA